MANSIGPLVNFQGGGGSTPPPTQFEPLGVVDRQNNIPSGWETTVRSRVFDLTWAEVQPTRTGPYNFSSIANFLTDDPVNSCAALGHKGILRLRAGWNAPTWVKTDCGSVLIKANTSTATGTSPMWASEFGRTTLAGLWNAVNTALAAEFGATPELQIVCLPGFTNYNEPCLQQVIGASGPDNRNALLTAGYVASEARLCLENFSVDMGAIWPTKMIYFPGNPYQYIVGTLASNSGTNSAIITNELHQHHRDVLGIRGEVGNNSIRSPQQNTDYTPMYNHLAAMSGPKGFQTSAMGGIDGSGGNAPNPVTDGAALDATIVNAAKTRPSAPTSATGLGATRVELPSGYWNVITKARMLELDALLRSPIDSPLRAP